MVGVCSVSEAQSIKLRAREHFEVHTIKVLGSDYVYKGASNTINIWYEIPQKWSLGLGISPLLGEAKNSEAVLNTGLGTSIKLFTVNIEFKYYFISGWFVRPGLGWADLQTGGTYQDFSGWNAYGGAGYEWQLGSIGLALEAAYRYSQLSEEVTITSVTPSIGFHFYKSL